MQLNPKELLGLNRKKEPDFQEIVKASFLRVKEHITSIENNIKSDKVGDNRQKEQFSIFLEQFNAILARLDKIESKMGEIHSSTGNEGVYSNIHSFNNHSNTQQKDVFKQPVIEEKDSGKSLEQIKDEIIKAVLKQAREEQKQEEAEQKKEKIADAAPVKIVPAENITAEKNMPLEKPLDLTRGKMGDTLGSQAVTKLEKSIFPLDLKPKMTRQEKPLQVISSSRQELLDRFSSLSKQELRTFLTIYDMEEEKSNVSYIDVAKKLNLSEGCIRSYISGLARKNIPLDKVKFNNKTVFLSIPKELKELGIKTMLISMYYETSMPQQRKLLDSF